MKKLLSLLCVLAVIAGITAIGAVSASAAVPTTEIDVKSGDKVTYSLSLANVPDKIVGCDFSVYYDDDAFAVDTVADFNDSTNEEDWSATINPDLKGEVRGNWSILNGVDFSKKRNIVTLNLTAKKDASKAHISYFVRYMYDNTVFDSDERPQIDQYLFTCDITKNGSAVVENAEPELNVEEEQPNGLFQNSRTGKSADADKALTGDSIKANGGANDGQSSGNNSGNNNSGNNNSGNNNSGNKSGNNGGNSGGNSGGSGNNSGDNKTNLNDVKGSENKSDAKKQPATQVTTDKDGKIIITEVDIDADGNVVDVDDADNESKETVASTNKDDGGGSSALLWIIIGAVVVIAGGAIGYVVYKGKAGAKKSDQ